MKKQIIFGISVTIIMIVSAIVVNAQFKASEPVKIVFTPLKVSLSEFSERYIPYPNNDGYESHDAMFTLYCMYGEKTLEADISASDLRPGDKLGSLKDSPIVNELKVAFKELKTLKPSDINITIDDFGTWFQVTKISKKEKWVGSKFFPEKEIVSIEANFGFGISKWKK